MVKRSVSKYDIPNVWKVIFSLLGVGMVLFAGVAIYIAFFAERPILIKANYPSCVPRPPCVDDGTCPTLVIPNICPQ